MSLKQNPSRELDAFCPQEAAFSLNSVSLPKEVKLCNVPNDENHQSFLQNKVTFCMIENVMRELNPESIKSEPQEICTKMDESPLKLVYSGRDDEYTSQMRAVHEEDFGGILMKDEVSAEFFEDPSSLTGVDGQKLPSKNENTHQNAPLDLLLQDHHLVKNCASSSKNEAIAEFVHLPQSPSKSLACNKSSSGGVCSRTESVGTATQRIPSLTNSTHENSLPLLDNNIYNCSSCSYQTTKKGNIMQHLRIHSGEKPFHCSVCPYRATQKVHIEKHSCIHSAKKLFMCGSCPYQTTWKSDIAEHLRTHTGEKPFQCTVCPYRAAKIGDLKRHSFTHSGEKPFLCPSCPYQAARKELIAAHLRTHTGEKPFQCNICPYQAARKAYIKQHLLIHTGEKPFKCSSCPYQTTRKASIDKHLRSHTGKI